jgi:hypothetical protein
VGTRPFIKTHLFWNPERSLNAVLSRGRQSSNNPIECTHGIGNDPDPYGNYPTLYKDFKMKKTQTLKTENTETTKLTFNDSDRIRVKTEDMKNPKRGNKNSFSNFQLYLDNPELTIGEFKTLFMEQTGNIEKKLKNPMSWIKWDLKHDFIEII